MTIWMGGIGLLAAREKLRVAHSLDAVPAIADAFRVGELSYCVEAFNRAQGLNIDSTTGITRWDGTRINYSITVGWPWTPCSVATVLCSWKPVPATRNTFLDRLMCSSCRRIRGPRN